MESSKDQKAKENFKIDGDWKNQSKHLKTKFPKLSDEDLKFEAGKENDLVNRVATKLNKDKEEVINILKETKPVQKLD